MFFGHLREDGWREKLRQKEEKRIRLLKEATERYLSEIKSIGINSEDYDDIKKFLKHQGLMEEVSKVIIRD
ncbi:hypothetical protein SAMN02745883_00729 [Caminicella sporogenes DSM 14501]|uniref:Uncharacterized protein n=1 Tax=Caminicella sporogenes DSM 14501 TaxID=1121266 RepID=A0A1M6N028_9FIRM|nr:hypothetical protein [Caminicella sporogenes]RKD22422.1 hypothetical protein BET04_05160 [Caminicella sporogenes]SHJ88986.1 hypothetical protein SAMN02745883_00729 [Caminicella sporogenes DSM 14501]